MSVAPAVKKLKKYIYDPPRQNQLIPIPCVSQEETQGKDKNKSFPCSEIRLTLGIL